MKSDMSAKEEKHAFAKYEVFKNEIESKDFF